MSNAGIRVWAVAPWRPTEPTRVAPVGSESAALSLPRGGLRSLQVVVDTPTSLAAVSLRVTGAASEAGRWEAYVAGMVPTRSGGMVVDPLFPCKGSLALPPDVTVFWLTLRAGDRPATASGQIEVAVDGVAVAALPLQVEVRRCRQPDPPAHGWLHLAQTPTRLADALNCTRWSNLHWHALAPYLTSLAEAGQRSITVELQQPPPERDRPNDRPCLIGWQRDRTRWRWDFELFDEYVALATHCGLTGRIHLSSLLPNPGASRECTFRAASGFEQTVEVGDATFIRVWQQFLRELAAHVTRTGWADRIVVAFGPKPADQLRPCLELIRAETPSLGFGATGGLEPDLAAAATDWHLPFELLLPVIGRQRRRDGRATWLLPPSDVPRPAFATLADPLAALRLGWMAAQHGADGVSLPAHHDWPRDPLRTPEVGTGPVGLRFQVYPGAWGPLPTPRWLLLCEGLQDLGLVLEARALAARKGGRWPQDVEAAVLQGCDIAADPNSAADPILKARGVLFSVLERLA